MVGVTKQLAMGKKAWSYTQHVSVGKEKVDDHQEADESAHLSFENKAACVEKCDTGSHVWAIN